MSTTLSASSIDDKLLSIVEVLGNPAIQEIAGFVQANKFNRRYHGLQSLSIYRLTNRIESLCVNGSLFHLITKAGYKDRYCICSNPESRRRRLHTNIVLKYKRTSWLHCYRVANTDVCINFTGLESSQYRTDFGTIHILSDMKYRRYYIVIENLLSGVVTLDKREPRLPWYLYGKGTEYERCSQIYSQQVGAGILGIGGKAYATWRHFS